MLFEKPALDSRKLAPGKGNNLILSNLAEAGKYCNPSRTQQSCERVFVCVWCCKFVLASCGQDCCPHASVTVRDKSVILILESFVEIAHIAFSAEVPIGAFLAELIITAD